MERVLETARVFVAWTAWEPAEDAGWVTRLAARVLKQHVFCVVEYATGFVVAEWTLRGMVLYPLGPKEAYELLVSSDVLHRVVVQYGSVRELHPLPEIATCVTFAKRLTGVRKWWVLTPKQLYKELTSG